MTEDNQNIDKHECAIGFVPNRVSDKTLSMEAPQKSLNDLDNAKFLCNEEEHKLQRENYVILVERMITSDIKCLQFLKNEVTKHILHAHSRDMAKKCHMVSNSKELLTKQEVCMVKILY